MANRVLYIDDVTGRYKLGLPPSSFGAVTFGDTATVNLTVDMFDNLTADVLIGGDLLTALNLKKDISTPPFIDEDFDLVAPASFLNLAGDITATTKIDVLINGVLTREGALMTWTRDDALNKILFNNAVSSGAWVRVRLFT